ncbi:MAG: T9SS type A sorting domain-containing protein, partial [candidate division WOR-3 bacterium]|nr:T9SS type A sorting domain-containing protein [candidate division WOR-3 bacterium]
LGYAWKDSLGWHTTHPYPGPWIDGTSLKLDKHDYPHIGYAVYIDNYTSLVMYSYWDGTIWHTETIDRVTQSAYPGMVSLVLDSLDNPYLAYSLGYPPKGLGYAKGGNGEWYIEIIDTSNWGCYPSIGIDSLERPCIAYGIIYRDSAGDWTKDLQYAVREDTGWRIEKVGTEGGYRTCLYLDKNNNPHISYEGNGWLKYAWRDSNRVWHIHKIDQVSYGGGMYAGYTGLALDDNDYAHISYYNHIEGCIMKYARGRPETGIEINQEKHPKVSLKVYPTIGQRRVQIEYVLKGRNEVNLCIYNIVGQKVIELAKEIKSSGRYTEYWDTQTIKSGIYFCCLRTGDESFITKKVIIIK